MANPSIQVEYHQGLEALEKMLSEVRRCGDFYVRGTVEVPMLEHQYSPDGFAGLKSADAARVKVLAQAAARVDCAVHLGIVHIEEYGAAEPRYDGGYGYGYRRRSRWHRYADEDEVEEHASSDDFEIVDVCDCRELQKFIFDPVEQSHRFRVRQDRRRHLHAIIDKHRLDMTHVTERKGSPQTLVCTKNRRSYQRRCDEYRKDIGALGALVELARKCSAADPWLNRIEAARSVVAEWSPA